MFPLISICIPAYKRTIFLKRLLNSILSQTFRDFEVIVSDDSDDDSVRILVEEYRSKFALTYVHNSPSLGTPKNWLKAVQQAKGEWIKIIHDDDWLANAYSLEKYAAATKLGYNFIFSGYNAYYETDKRLVSKTISQARFKYVLANPDILFADNVLGPPSVLMYKRSVTSFYNLAMKWYVDIEFYIRSLKHNKACYIDESLINMSYNDTQVTNFCFRQPEYEIPEALIIANSPGTSAHIIVYDAWWRLIRNLDVREESYFTKFAKEMAVPVFILRIIRLQSHIPPGVLKIGVFSKLLMTLSFLFNR